MEKTTTTTSQQPNRTRGKGVVPLLMREGETRFVALPVRHPSLWTFYKKAEASFWTAEEIDLANDRAQYARLTNDERHFLDHVLAFFAASDGIVNENLAQRFCSDVQLFEARAFYGFQIAMENIHSETYALLIDTYVETSDRKASLFQAIRTMDCVAKKAEWAMKWIESTEDFATRLVAFACVEGIFFSGSFCAIFWLKKQGKMPGLTFSNELISRDEGMHCDFACELHSMLLPSLSDLSDATLLSLGEGLKDEEEEEEEATDLPPSLRERVAALFPSKTEGWRRAYLLGLKASLRCDRIEEIVTDAVRIEEEFVSSSLPVELLGMNSTMMKAYIRFVADRLLVALGREKVYGDGNPFDWMELISLQGKTNFFEKRVGEYQKCNVMQNSSKTFTTEEDF